MSRRLPIRLATHLLCAATAASAQTAAKPSQAVPEEFFLACGSWSGLTAVETMEKLDELSRSGIANSRPTTVWLSNGMVITRLVAGPYKTRALAQRRLTELGDNSPCKAVIVDNAETKAQQDANYRKRQEMQAAQRGTATRSGDGAYGYDYKYQQWKSCVERHSNQSWSSSQVGMGYAKCGDAPTP